MVQQAHPASFDGRCDWERGAGSGKHLIISYILDAEYVAKAVTVKCIESGGWTWPTASMFRIRIVGLEGHM